ncbi:dethiobiotin synthase, partial [Salmonella sp. 741265072_HSA]
QPPGARHGEYLATLRRVIPAPLLGEIPWLGVSPSQAATGQYLDLSPLERA